MTKLTGKTVLITAAGQGIGRATAELFAAQGAQVIASDINEAALTELDSINGITARKLDVLDGHAVTAATVRATWRLAISYSVKRAIGTSASI